MITDRKKPFSSAADATKRPAKCAIAHEPTDDKADVVLLNGFYKVKFSPRYIRRASALPTISSASPWIRIFPWLTI